MLVPVKEIVIPGGQVKYQCTRCWGVYNSRQQAETVNPRGPINGRNLCHRCRARPMLSNRKSEK